MAENPSASNTYKVGQYKGDVAQVRFSSTSLIEADAALQDIPNGVARAAVNAINKTLAGAKRMATAGLIKYLIVSEELIRSRVLSVKAKVPRKLGQGSDYNALNIRGRLKVLGYKTPLANAQYRDTKSIGVFWRMIRGDTPKQERNAFAAIRKTGASAGKVAILRRLTKARYPLAPLYTESIYDIYTKSPLSRRVVGYIDNTLNPNFESAVTKQLKRK